MAKSDVWVIRKADDQTLQISVVTNRRFDDIQLPPELSSELNIPTRGVLNTILNSVFMAGMQEEADNQLRKSIKAATEDVDRASQLLAERGIRARENICTCCNEEHEILYHAVGDPTIAICPRCQTLHKEASDSQTELPIVTPFDPMYLPEPKVNDFIYECGYCKKTVLPSAPMGWKNDDVVAMCDSCYEEYRNDKEGFQAKARSKETDSPEPPFHPFQITKDPICDGCTGNCTEDPEACKDSPESDPNQEPVDICPKCHNQMTVSDGIGDGTHFYECQTCEEEQEPEVISDNPQS